MALPDAPFYPEIEALDENCVQFFYTYQSDWLERGHINFQAIQSLWDILNNVWDNLDELGITLDELGPALRLIKELNATASDV